MVEAAAQEDLPETESAPATEIEAGTSYCATENNGDILSELCGQATSQDNKDAGIKNTWKTRNSNGSITSSSDDGAEEPAVRDHSLSSVESSNSHVSVSRNLKDEMASVKGEKEEEIDDKGNPPNALALFPTLTFDSFPQKSLLNRAMLTILLIAFRQKHLVGLFSHFLYVVISDIIPTFLQIVLSLQLPLHQRDLPSFAQ